MDLKIDKFFPSLSKISVDQKKTVFEILSSNFNAVDQSEIKMMMASNKAITKNANISEKQRNIGNDLFQNHNFKSALNYYYLSLQLAPYDSYDYVMALAERSKAHFALKNYKEALIDIERVLSSSIFPKEMLCKIYIRQSQCFLYLKQYFNTLDSCDKAYNNLKKIERDISPDQFEIRHNFIRGIVDKIDEFSNDEDQPPNNEPQFIKPPLKDGENPKFLNASNAVGIKYNDKKGRHVIAKANLKPGDILFVEEPYCAVRNDDYRFSMRYCSNCMAYCETSLPCKYCIIHFYCTESCRQSAWNKEHRWICYGERNALLGDAMRLTLSIIFKAAANNFDTNVTDKSVYGNRNDNFPFIYNLVTNRNKMSNKEISQFIKLTIWLVIYLKEYTDFFIWLHEKPAFKEKKMSELYEIVGGHILQLCMQIHCNSDEIIDASIDLPKQQLQKYNIGIGVYVSCAMINHSCLPNTITTFEQTVKVVRATKKITKNSEVTIDYLSFYNGRQYLDKNFIRNNYKFNCTCLKCTYPLKDDKKPWLCTKCHGKAFNITETQAKCAKCGIIFNLKGYKHMENTLEIMFQFPSVSAIENIHKKMKKIYHKDNINFTHQLNMTYDYYSEDANIPKFIEISKDLVQLCDKYNDIDEMKLHAYLKLLRSTGMKCFFMRLELLPFDKASFDEFQEIKTKGLNMLKYFVSAKHIKEYKKYIHDFLDSNEPY